MRIKEIEVTNFKSFDYLKLELGKFNVFVGPNAAGKSNLVEIFKFLKDIATEGLDNAISMQGREYLANIIIGDKHPIFIKTIIDCEGEFGRVFGNLKTAMKMVEMSYELQIMFAKSLTEFSVSEEKIVCSGEVFEESKNLKNKEIGKYKYMFSRVNDAFNFKIIEKPESISIKELNVIDDFFYDTKGIDKKGLLLNMSFLRTPIQETFGKIKIYNFDPKLSKKAVPLTGRAELESNGENFAIVLKKITEDKTNEKKLRSLIKDVLPFVSKLETERFADKSLLFKLQETYFKKHDVLAPFISDGTINIIVMIVALYFEEKMVTIIEEPERYIHPHLIAKIVEMMKDVSNRKQVLVTTHSPEVLKNAGLDNIYCITRTEEGFSAISRPKDMENVKIFLKNDMGIDQLFIDNLLGN